MSDSTGAVDVECSRRSHAGARADLRPFDCLPPAVRALLRDAPVDHCSSCIRVLLKQHGLRAVVAWLAADARHEDQNPGSRSG